MTYTSVTIDLSSFTEDFPNDIRKRIYDHYRQRGQHPKYVLLGHREYEYLRLEFTREPYFTIYAIDHMTGRDTFCGIEILRVDRESFTEVV